MISVIVPVYNSEKYVDDCIESIINQTYTDFEIILVDDGSTDSSLEICKYHERLDDRIRVFSRKNGGVAQARQFGFEKASGDYVTYIDSDDSIKPNFIEKMYEGICKSEADVICCNSVDEGIINTAISANEVIEDPAVLIEALLCNKRYAFCVWAKMFRTSLLKNITFKDMKYAEDTYYVTEAFQKAKKVMLLSYAGYNYRSNADGAMQNAKGIQQEKDVLRFYQYVLNLCKSIYPQCYELCIGTVVNKLYNLISAASTSSIQDKKEAYDIIRYMCLHTNKIIQIKSAKQLLINLYMLMPAPIMFAFKMHKKFEGEVRKR